MLVFCNGIAGCGEKQYLETFRDLCEQKRKDLRIHDLGEKLVEIGRKDYPDLSKYDLMGFPESTVNAWRAAALESILSDIKEEKADLHVLDAHASFWVKNGPEPAINTSYLQELDPDVYIQIVDYEPDIRDRLHANPELPDERKPSLEEIVRWQEVERYTNRILSDFHRRPFYVIARQHPAVSLYNIVFEGSLPKIYTSFPITHLDDGSLEEIGRYVDELREQAVVFDPIEIDSRDFENTRVRELITNHTVKRDEQFIDQSDLVVVNFPEIVYSSGVEYEVNYASRTGKPVWIIKPEGEAGPFTDYNCDREFVSQEACLKALREKYGDSNG